MHWTIILFLISVIISGIIAHLLHNSHFYRNEDPVKLPLIVWIIFVVITLIPIVNCIACLMYIIVITCAYCDNEIEFNDNFWLAKMY